MYKDYAISASEFAWDSQNATTPESQLGQLFQHHEELGRRIVLFVRRNKKDAIGTIPTCAWAP